MSGRADLTIPPDDAGGDGDEVERLVAWAQALVLRHPVAVFSGKMAI